MEAPFRLSTQQVATIVSRVRAEGALRRALRAQDLPSSCPSLEEESIMSRLQAAWTLRSDATLAMNFVSVRYEALPELSTFLVMTPNAARRWGETQDFQDLADRLQFHFPFGNPYFRAQLGLSFPFSFQNKALLTDSSSCFEVCG